MRTPTNKPMLIAALVGILALAGPALAATAHPVVFLGASVIRFWPLRDPDFFKAHPSYLVRGADGQTTMGTLRRTARDILPLEPSLVLLQPTGNDRGFNFTAAESRDNLVAIAELVRAKGSKVVFIGGASASPVDDLISDYARSQNIAFVDVSVLHGPDGAIKASLSVDGVHPNLAGYRLIDPLVARAIDKALAQD